MIKKRVIKRILIGIGLSCCLVVGSGILFSIIYKNEIIGVFLRETNKHITTPINVEKIEISLLSKFPDISIDLKNVTVRESTNNHKGILGKAKQISVSFNPIDIINKNYSVSGIHIFDAEVTLKIDKYGHSNYLFYKKDSTSGNTIFSLDNVSAKNLSVDYLDEKSNYRVALVAKNVSSKLGQKDKILSVHLEGDLISDEIKVNKRVFFNNKSLKIDSEFEVDLKEKSYSFKSLLVQVDKGKFDVSGNLDPSGKSLDLKIIGLNTNFQSINSLLSSDLAKHFEGYNTKGNVYFTGMVRGTYGANRSPHVNVEFGAKKASFFHPQYNRQINNLNLEGHFTSGKKNNSSSYRLDIKNFFCTLEDKQLQGSLSLQNFKDYHMDLILKGEADVNTLMLLFSKKYTQTAFGNIKIDIHVHGKLRDPKLTKNINANGEIELGNISLVLTGKKLPLNKLNGSLILRNNDLAISNLTGFVGNSDFRLNGFINDISSFFTQKNLKYKMQADLQATFLDFDELLKSNFASRDTTTNKTSPYEFKISPKLDLDFNCEIDMLKFKRFRGRQIIGNVEIKDQIAVLKNVSFSSMGGNLKISGSVNNKRKNLVETISEASLSNINVDSVFYVFKNFNQNWLVDKNLKGQLDADINLYMNFDRNLVLNSKSLVADIHTSIANGELNDFEPMMELSKFVEEESLAQMRFSKMSNEIKIENRTIYLPQMEIRSNVSNILVSGTHTFDNDIDYHLSVPLKSFIRISKKKNFDQNSRQGMNLLLKLHGHTSDYTISYDTKALKDNIKRDFLDEGKEWRNLKKRDRHEKNQAPELEEEYFDFEESESAPPNNVNQ
ncbi:MAG: DUF3971 domain-containing protein [Cytophagales bacterium]|nr:DUF3971 domain-containing protein [Cytophagales bacterium]